MTLKIMSHVWDPIPSHVPQVVNFWPMSQYGDHFKLWSTRDSSQTYGIDMGPKLSTLDDSICLCIALTLCEALHHHACPQYGIFGPWVQYAIHFNIWCTRDGTQGIFGLQV